MSSTKNIMAELLKNEDKENLVQQPASSFLIRKRKSTDTPDEERKEIKQARSSINCDPLKKLLTMDFNQLRALKGEGLRALESRATDLAITEFVQHINDFFSQLTNHDLSAKERKTVNDYFNKIISKINVVEQLNGAKKYQDVDPKTFNITLEKLSARMQFWASNGIHGDAIRNPDEHRKAVAFLSDWNTVKGAQSRYDSGSDSEEETNAPLPF